MLNLTSHDNFYLENFWENLIKVCERRRTFWCGIFVERFELLVREWNRKEEIERGAGFESNRNWESLNRGKSCFLSQLLVELSCWNCPNRVDWIHKLPLENLMKIIELATIDLVHQLDLVCDFSVRKTFEPKVGLRRDEFLFRLVSQKFP